MPVLRFNDDFEFKSLTNIYVPLLLYSLYMVNKGVLVKEGCTPLWFGHSEYRQTPPTVGAFTCPNQRQVQFPSAGTPRAHAEHAHLYCLCLFRVILGSNGTAAQEGAKGPLLPTATRWGGVRQRKVY